MPPAEAPPAPSVVRMLVRGLVHRCPLCGSGGCFHSWFRMRDRCPRCNFPLDRIEGHWIGALGINTIVSFGLLLVTLVVGFVVTWPDPPVAVLTAIGLAIALVVPFAFFPSSRMVWSAVDLAMRPVEPADDVDPRYIPRGRT